MIDQILDHCELYEIEIVSFGLAPNPSGLCFEVSDKTPRVAAELLNRWLNSLTKAQENELKERVFGIYVK